MDKIDFIIFSLAALIFLGTYFGVIRYVRRKEMMGRIANINSELTQSANPTKKKESALGFYFERLVDKIISGKSSSYAENAKTLFAQAGWPPAKAPYLSVLIQLGLALVFAVSGYIGLQYVNLGENKDALNVALFVLSVLLGAQSYNYFMKFMIHLRVSKIKKDLSNALDLLVVCTRAGASIDNALQQVAQEIGNFNKELGKELLTTAIELGVLPSRRLAFENLVSRVDIQMIHIMVTSLVQSEEQGTSISEALRNLSIELRDTQLLEFEAKAARLPSLLTIPVVLCTLPVLMIVLLAPAILNGLKSFG